MKITPNYGLILATSVLLLTDSQLTLAQAADYSYTYTNQLAQPAYNTSTQNHTGTRSYDSPVYGSTDHLTPGYTQSYYGVRNYGHDSSTNPWSGRGPGFTGPWDGVHHSRSKPWSNGSGSGFSAPWNSGRGKSGPSFSGPWDSGSQYRKPW